MEPTLEEKDIHLLQAIQDEIPLVAEPFRAVGKSLGLGEEEVLTRLKNLKDRGVVRRFSASIDHRRIGVVANAMVVWRVPPNRVEEVGKAFAKNGRVTHCYLRSTVPDRWLYNLYTVLHGYDHVTVERLVKEMSRAVGIEDYLLLFSTREFKKSSNGRLVTQILKGTQRRSEDT